MGAASAPELADGTGRVIPAGGIAYWLSGALAVAAALSALLTYLVSDVLRGPAVMNGSARGTALVVLLVGVPVLACSLVLARRGSAIAVVTWLAAVGFLLYNALMFVFATPVNRLFLLYLAMLSLAAWSAGTLLWHTDTRALGRLIPARAPVRLAAGYLWAVVMLNGGAWLVRILPSLANSRGACLPAGHRDDDEHRVRAGPGPVAAADGRRGSLAVAAQAAGLPARRSEHCDGSHGEHQHRGGPVVRARSRPRLRRRLGRPDPDFRGSRGAVAGRGLAAAAGPGSGPGAGSLACPAAPGLGCVAYGWPRRPGRRRKRLRRHPADPRRARHASGLPHRDPVQQLGSCPGWRCSSAWPCRSSRRPS